MGNLGEAGEVVASMFTGLDLMLRNLKRHIVSDTTHLHITCTYEVNVQCLGQRESSDWISSPELAFWYASSSCQQTQKDHKQLRKHVSFVSRKRTSNIM